MTSILEKLAAEVSKDGGKRIESKAGESGTGDKKADGGKGFPPKSDKAKGGEGSFGAKGGDEGKKETGKASPFGKKPEGEKGSPDQSGKDSQGKSGNPFGKGSANGDQEKKEGQSGSGEGDEQEIPGNESGEGPAVPGSTAVNPTAIIDFFAQNPNPNDEAFHEFAESQQIDIHAAESVAYNLASKYVMFLRGGKSGGKVPEGIDPEQLNKGIEVEAEHSSDPATAKKIAIDHLTEMPDYYTRLDQMEGSGGQVVAEPNGQEQGQGQEQAQEQQQGKQQAQ